MAGQPSLRSVSPVRTIRINFSKVSRARSLLAGNRKRTITGHKFDFGFPVDDRDGFRGGGRSWLVGTEGVGIVVCVCLACTRTYLPREPIKYTAAIPPRPAAPIHTLLPPWTVRPGADPGKNAPGAAAAHVRGPVNY